MILCGMIVLLPPETGTSLLLKCPGFFKFLNILKKRYPSFLEPPAFILHQRSAIYLSGSTVIKPFEFSNFWENSRRHFTMIVYRYDHLTKFLPF